MLCVLAVLVLGTSVLALAVPGLAESPDAATDVTGSHNGLVRPCHVAMNAMPAEDVPSSFAFVSTFQDLCLDGWSSISGTSPSISTRTTYYGEPSLASTATRTPQIDVANEGFVLGQTWLSFQVAINPGKGTGYFGLADASNKFVAVVGVSHGQVWAGHDLTSLSSAGPVPTGTAYPDRWVYLAANIYNASTDLNPTAGLLMDVFVDGCNQAPATVPVPDADSYAEALIETTSGTVYYTYIVVTTSLIPYYVAGYNNMAGYGQGSALYVELLPAFTTLRAEMTLTSWSVPQRGILSFQINAMNYQGTTTPSCEGFFQLGIDLNPNGVIAPWYVPGKNCFGHYMMSSANSAQHAGVGTPAGTHLVLTITYDAVVKKIIFTIVDTTIGQTFTQTISNNDGPFYGVYSQIEWQPCCSDFPIEDYHFSGILYNNTITTLNGSVQVLKSDYMIPFAIDAPPNWSLTYYQDNIAGYRQLA